MNTYIEACLYSQAHYGVGGSFEPLNALQQWEAAGVLPVNRVSEIFILAYNYAVHVMKLELKHRQSTEVEYQITRNTHAYDALRRTLRMWVGRAEQLSTLLGFISGSQKNNTWLVETL